MEVRMMRPTRLIQSLFLSLIVFGLLAPSMLRAQSQGNSTKAAPTDVKPQVNPAEQALRDAATKSKTAATSDDFSLIISLCQEGTKLGATGDNLAYAKKLQAWALNRRGEQYSDAGDEKMAMKDFEAAIASDSKQWKALQNRGVSRATAGNMKDAFEDFSAVIRINPSYANAWYNRGELKYDQADYSGAVRDYTQAIQLTPSDAAFFNSRGHANYRMGQFREALADYNRAVQLDPKDAGALVNRGDAYRDQNVFGAAAADYKDAIKIDPKLGRAFLSTAWLMATCPDSRYRDAEKAVAAAQKAIELDGDGDFNYLDTLAAAQANAGRFDEAKTTIQKAMAIAPKDMLSKLRQRSELYDSGRAYREGAPAEPVRAASVRQP
jgi:tetratricopeptide (TPR) repeat protein